MHGYIVAMEQWNRTEENAIIDRSMKNPFVKAIKKHSGKDPTESDQKDLGKPQGTALADEHANFLQTVLKLIDDGKIDLVNPQSVFNQDVYEGLSDELKAKTDQTLPNIISLLERIMDLHSRPEENESMEMKNLIETLWQAKQRIEEHADVFIF